MKGREEGRISSRVIDAFSGYWENCNSNIDRSGISRNFGRKMEAVDDYCVEGRQRFPRDYTRTTTMGQVVEQGGSWTPSPPSKERERK